MSNYSRTTGRTGKSPSRMNRFFRRSLLGLLCSTALLTVSCKDKNTTSSSTVCANNPGTCQSVLEAKDFFAFKVGSWWVYEEENSHLHDSMYVTASVNSSNSYFNVQVESALTGYKYHYWPVYYSNISGCNENGTVLNKCLYVKRSKGKFQDDLADGYILFYAHKVGDFVGVSNIHFTNNKIVIDTILNTFHLENYTFSKTVKVHELSTYQEGNQPTNFYYSKNVGIVRKELLDSNQVWNLVAYHIEK